MPKPMTNRSREELAFRRSCHTQFTTRDEGEDLIIEGYFVVIDKPYYMWDDMEEVVCRGAFDGCDTSDVRALTDHDSRLVLGRCNQTIKTLTFYIDDYGLFGSIRVNRQDLDAMNLHARVLRGDVDQASFGFDEEEVAYIDLADGRTRREIRKISKLWEITVCTFPAYEQTFITARERDEAAVKAVRLERWKRNQKRRLRHHHD